MQEQEATSVVGEWILFWPQFSHMYVTQLKVLPVASKRALAFAKLGVRIEPS